MNVNDKHYGNDIPEKTKVEILTTWRVNTIVHIIEWNCFNKHIHYITQYTLKQVII